MAGTLEGRGERKDLAARARSVAAAAGLAAGSVLATLIVVELLLSALFEPIYRPWQVQDLFRLDDELIYSLAPSFDRIAKSEEMVEHATTNRHGLRDGEIRPRESFEKRIIVLGDSMIFGHGVGDDETFPNQLEAIYREQRRSIDVINAGVKGYGTDGAYKLFERRIHPLGLEPDLVIFGVYHNDLKDNIGQPLYTIEDGSLAPLDPTRNWIHLLGRIEQRAPEFIRNRVLYSIGMWALVGRDVYSVLPDLSEAELLAWAARKAHIQIAELRKRGRREGFQVLVLCVPHRDGPRGIYTWIEPVRERGAWLFDPSRDPVWEAEKRKLFFTTDDHFSPAGNRRLAEMVKGALDRAGF